MFVPIFGWSAGNIVLSVDIPSQVGQASRDAGGAKGKSTKFTGWLDGFACNFQRLHECFNKTEYAKYLDDFQQ